jgi:uncharacterized repeat protein (TIGR01451 family)
MAMLASTAIPAPEAYAATTRTIDVDNIDDNNPGGGCTVREAIDVANAGLGAGTAANACTVTESGAGIPITYEINLPSYTYTLSGAAGNDDNTSGDLDILANVTINGVGAGNTIIDGGSIDQVFDIPISDLGLTVNISNVTVQNGHGGGIHNNGATMTINNSTISNNKTYVGGGIYTSGGTVTISNSTIANNEAAIWAGGGIQIRDSTVHISNSTIANNTGRGIHSGWSDTTTLNVIDSTIFGNNDGGITAGIANRLNIANSTISDNFTNHDGGGIFSLGTTNLTNVTITNNIADNDNNGNGDGGGIYGGGAFNIKNSIVAGNTDRSGEGPDCSGTFVSGQYNLIGVNTGCIVSFPGGSPNVNNDFVGTGTIPFDPVLGGLTGDPAFHLLQLGSPAVDKIPATNCTFISSGTNPLFTNGDPVTTDQPGTIRDSTCDIGAFEVPSVGIQVLDGVTDVPDDTGNVDFGSTLGTPVTKTFTVKNIGKTSPLTLSDLTVPAGFGIASDFGSTTVITGAQTSFAIKFNAAAALTFSGQLSFTNNVVNRNPFNFTVNGAAVQVALTKIASSDTIAPSQTLTYTLVVSNSGGTSVTNAQISDTLPTGLNFVGPVWLDPPGTALVPPSLPILVRGLTIAAGESITLTFPVTVDTRLDRGAMITNTAAITSTEMVIPAIGRVKITISGWEIYLPLILRSS